MKKIFGIVLLVVGGWASAQNVGISHGATTPDDVYVTEVPMFDDYGEGTYPQQNWGNTAVTPNIVPPTITVPNPSIVVPNPSITVPNPSITVPAPSIAGVPEEEPEEVALWPLPIPAKPSDPKLDIPAKPEAKPETKPAKPEAKPSTYDSKGKNWYWGLTAGTGNNEFNFMVNADMLLANNFALGFDMGWQGFEWYEDPTFTTDVLMKIIGRPGKVEFGFYGGLGLVTTEAMWTWFLPLPDPHYRFFFVPVGAEFGVKIGSGYLYLDGRYYIFDDSDYNFAAVNVGYKFGSGQSQAPIFEAAPATVSQGEEWKNKRLYLGLMTGLGDAGFNFMANADLALAKNFNLGFELGWQGFPFDYYLKDHYRYINLKDDELLFSMDMLFKLMFRPGKTELAFYTGIGSTFDDYSPLFVPLGAQVGFNLGPGILYLDARYNFMMWGSWSYDFAAYNIGYKFGLGKRTSTALSDRGSDWKNKPLYVGFMAGAGTDLSFLGTADLFLAKNFALGLEMGALGYGYQFTNYYTRTVTVADMLLKLVFRPGKLQVGCFTGAGINLSYGGVFVPFGVEFGVNLGPGLLFMDVRSDFAHSSSINLGYKFGVGGR